MKRFSIEKRFLFLENFQYMATIFTKIIQGEIPSYKVAEDEHFFAFLDIYPNSKGHTLVIPKKEVNKIFDLDENTYNGLMSFSYKVAKALERSVSCERIGMSVVGLEVPHVHVHLIPIKQMDDMRFTKKEKLSHEEFASLAKKIARNFS